MHVGPAALGEVVAVFLAERADLEVGKMLPPAFRADVAPNAARRCVPATGAQVLGGFAGPYDWLDPMTGEICNR
jgi:hypothetical protein